MLRGLARVLRRQKAGIGPLKEGRLVLKPVDLASGPFNMTRPHARRHMSGALAA
jgi:hypothetical protein